MENMTVLELRDTWHLGSFMQLWVNRTVEKGAALYFQGFALDLQWKELTPWLFRKTRNFAESTEANKWGRNRFYELMNSCHVCASEDWWSTRLEKVHTVSAMIMHHDHQHHPWLSCAYTHSYRHPIAKRHLLKA